MEASSGRRTQLPVVYGGVVLVLLLAGFLLRGFSFAVGDAGISGRYSLLPLLGAHSPRALSFTWNGLSLHFSSRSTPGLVDVLSAPGDTQIVLAGGERLRLVPGQDPGGSLTIADVPSSGGAQGILLVPFTVAGLLVDTPPGAALAWRSDGRTFLLSLPPTAHVDTDTGIITLPTGSGSWNATLTLAGTQAVAQAATPTRSTPQEAAAQTRLPVVKDLPTQAQLQDAVSRWLDQAYAGWSSSRFSAADGRWTTPGASPGVSEQMGVGLLAESVARGTWKTIEPLWTDAVTRARARGDGGALSYVTSAFIGDTQDWVRASAADAAEGLAQAHSLLAAGDPSVVRTPDLVPLLLDHGSPDDLAAAQALLTARTLPSLDAAGTLGLLAALDDMNEMLSGVDVRGPLQDAITRRVMPLLRNTDQGVFLESSPGTVDVAASIRCGSLLLRAGTSLSDARAAGLGRAQLVAALALADASGIVPATLTLSGARVASRAGSLAPERLYALVPSGRFLPREVPLARQVAAGVSLWTVAEVTAQKEGAALRLVFGYPAGVPHYFVLQGIGPFGQVTLHGIPWHADPSYGKYSDGWYYDAAARVFYGKLTGRSSQEEIDIAFPGQP